MPDSDIDTILAILLGEDLLAQLRTATTLPAPAMTPAPRPTAYAWRVS